MSSLIILSGPVGAGKSTVAKALVENATCPTACIEGDLFWNFIGTTSPQRNRYQDFKTIMASMVAAAIPFANAGSEVILDFSIPPWFLPTTLSILKKREIPLRYIVIRPSIEICTERAASRSEGTIEDYSRYGDLYADFDNKEQYTIDNGETDAKTVAAMIRDGLLEGRFRVVEA